MKINLFGKMRQYLTRSWSSINDRKSTRSGARSSSYDWEVSAKVYRIADTTVALVAAFLSWIRAWQSKDLSVRGGLRRGHKAHMQLRQIP